MSDIAGLARQHAVDHAGLRAGRPEMIGVPLTAGFISKWALIEAAIPGQLVAVVVVLIGSLLAVLYIGRVVEAAYLKPAPERAEPVREAPLGLLLPMWSLILANFWFGIDTRLTAGCRHPRRRDPDGGAP